MNRALWQKTIREGFWLLLGSVLLIFVYHWLRVWITSQFETTYVQRFLQHAPPYLTDMLPVDVKIFASPAGRVAIAYEDPLVVTVVAIWAIARGSDVVSGEIGRGTMEMLLAQPVRRIAVLFTHASFTIFGLAVLAVAAWLGTAAGLSMFELEKPVLSRIYLPAALNLFALGMFLAGLATLFSSCDRYRSRTIGVVVTIFIVATILRVVSMAVPEWEWLRYATFMTCFDPQKLAHAFWPETLARSASASWKLLLQYNGLLIALGLIYYAAAAVIFCRRDLPAPL